MGKGISREEEVIKYLKGFQAKHYRMPTRKEACHDLKMWPGALGRILNRAEEKGRLARLPHAMINFKVRW